MALQAPSVLNAISDDTHMPPRISLAWLKKLDVCNNWCFWTLLRITEAICSNLLVLTRISFGRFFTLRFSLNWVAFDSFFSHMVEFTLWLCGGGTFPHSFFLSKSASMCFLIVNLYFQSHSSASFCQPGIKAICGGKYP